MPLAGRFFPKIRLAVNWTSRRGRLSGSQVLYHQFFPAIQRPGRSVRTRDPGNAALARCQAALSSASAMASSAFDFDSFSPWTWPRLSSSWSSDLW